MSSILPCSPILPGPPCPPPVMLSLGQGSGHGRSGGGKGKGRGRGSGGGGQGIFWSSCHILHCHMVLRPKGTSHNKHSTDAVFCLNFCAVTRQKQHPYHMRNIELCPKDLYSLFGSRLLRISTQIVRTRLSYSVQYSLHRATLQM